MKSPRQLLLALMCGFCLLAAARGDDDLPAIDKKLAEKTSFRGDVWPILKRHCWGCHSKQESKGGLSVGSVAEMLEGGDSGPLFEPGKADESLLLEMIRGDEPEMPKQQPKLSTAKIQVLRHWIAGGGKDDSTGAEAALAVRIPETYKFAPAVSSVALSPDGKLLAAGCRSEVVLIDVAKAAPVRRLQTQSDLVTHVEFDKQGVTLAAAGGSPSQHGEVRFFQVADGSLLNARRAGNDTLFRGGFSPDGKSIALGGADGAVHVVPLDPKGKVRSFDLHSDWVMDVAYTPDGKMLVSGGRDKATKICSVEDGSLLRTVDNSTELISSVAADGQFAVSAGRAKTLIGFELKVALSGVQVTGAGNGARPVSKRNQYVKNFEGQPGVVLDIASSGDRKTIAVAGAFGEVRVYKVADRQRVALISAAPAPVYAVALNSDGSVLALGAKDGRVQVYTLPDAKLKFSLTPVPVAKPPKVATSEQRDQSSDAR